MLSLGSGSLCYNRQHFLIAPERPYASSSGLGFWRDFSKTRGHSNHRGEIEYKVQMSVTGEMGEKMLQRTNYDEHKGLETQRPEDWPNRTPRF